MQSTFLTAEWRKLAILNYSVDPAILEPYLPYKTELDFWKDRCYVSLVAFRFMNTRLRGVRIPFHSDFEEINLRFYVRYLDGSVWRRGVSFIKEIVPKRALAIVANAVYKEKYITLPTKRTWIENEDEIKVSYSWKHQGEWDFLSLAATPPPLDITSGSEEEFITEHYWGYTQVSERATSQYQVEHQRWQVYPIKTYQAKIRFGEMYGAAFGSLKDALPDSIMLAEGSAITVRRSDKIV